MVIPARKGAGSRYEHTSSGEPEYRARVTSTDTRHYNPGDEAVHRNDETRERIPSVSERPGIYRGAFPPAYEGTGEYPGFWFM